MRQDQIKYARERLAAIYKERLNRLSSLIKPAKHLSIQEMCDALENGAFTLDRLASHINYAIKFNAATPEDRTEYQREIEKLRAKYEAICDELLLGDAEKALSLIKKFSQN